MSVIARHMIVKGRVQGVAYRAWTVQTAGVLGLSGWVRNRSDGTVEAVVQGVENAVERFIAEAWDGPPAASVEHIGIDVITVSDMRDFEQRPTA